MADKEPKPGAPVAAVPKAPVVRAKAPKKPIAAAKAVHPVVEAPVPPLAVPAPVDPVPVVEAAPQISETAVESVAAASATAIATATEAAPAIAAVESARKEPSMTTIDKAQSLFTEMNDRAKTVAEKSTKAVEELNEFAKGNVEALVESGKITAKGLETMGQDAAEYGRRSFEQATAALKSLSAVKTPTEFFKLHSDFARSAFDAYVAEASKNTEALIKLAGEAVQPLSNRFAVAAEKVKASVPTASAPVTSPVSAPVA
jgi:phasin family protein